MHIWHRYLDWIERETRAPSSERVLRALLRGGLLLGLALVILLGAAFLLRTF